MAFVIGWSESDSELSREPLRAYCRGIVYRTGERNDRVSSTGTIDE